MGNRPEIGSLFNPRSIAVVGASIEKGRPSNVIIESLDRIGFNGDIFPVNPRHSEINGHKCHPSISVIKNNIDLAVIALPSHLVVESVREAARCRVKNAIIISAGFRETGEKGTEMEAEISRIIHDTGIRVMGPNCMGLYDTISKVDTFFVPPDRMGRPKKGGVSIISQSGSFAVLIMDELAHEGIGVARVVNYGNRVDIGEAECLEFLADDRETKAVFIYVESVSDGRRFVDAAARCARKKPVVAIKVGRGRAGMGAAMSHTGAMTGRHEIYSAAFRRAGIIEVGGYEGLKDACRSLSAYKRTRGGKVAIITSGGGIGVRLADACEEAGLEVAPFPKNAVARLKKRLPPYYTSTNPIDLTGSATDDEYIFAVEEGIRNHDIVIVALLWGPPMLTEGLADRLIDISSNSGKPFIICSPGGRFTIGINRRFAEAGVPVFSTPESAARGAYVLVKGNLLTANGGRR